MKKLWNSHVFTTLFHWWKKKFSFLLISSPSVNQNHREKFFHREIFFSPGEKKLNLLFYTFKLIFWVWNRVQLRLNEKMNILILIFACFTLFEIFFWQTFFFTGEKKIFVQNARENSFSQVKKIKSLTPFLK